MELERGRVYCSGWGFVSESGDVIEILNLEGSKGLAPES
jgi:hypothetical protein